MLFAQFAVWNACSSLMALGRILRGTLKSSLLAKGPLTGYPGDSCCRVFLRKCGHSELWELGGGFCLTLPRK
jgi:hypothetical protein